MVADALMTSHVIRASTGMTLIVSNYNITTKPWGRFKNMYELLNQRAFIISMLYTNHIFQFMGETFCVEFQRYPLKFHTKYLTHTLKDMDFILK